MGKSKSNKPPQKPRPAAVAKKMDGKKPKLRTKWVDFEKRMLVVTKVEGARVHGKITFNPTGRTGAEITRDYSIDLKMFEHIWMEQKAPATSLDMYKQNKEAVH